MTGQRSADRLYTVEPEWRLAGQRRVNALQLDRLSTVEHGWRLENDGSTLCRQAVHCGARMEGQRFANRQQTLSLLTPEINVATKLYCNI
jgi:hypothetical protein